MRIELKDNALSSSSEALTTEPLGALWRAGSKFKCNYTSHERDEDARLIITIKTLKKTNLGVVQVLFHYLYVFG